MSNNRPQNPLLEKILSGNAGDDLLELLYERNLPFREDEYLEAYVSLIQYDMHRVNAEASASGIPKRIKQDYISRREGREDVFRFIVSEALSSEDVKIVTSAINNQILPIDILEKIAEQGNSQLLEVLIQNQVKMIAYPEILDIIEENPNMDNFVTGKIRELREYYLGDEEVNTFSEEEVLKEVREIVAKLEKRDEVSEDEEFLFDEEDFEIKTLTAIQKINSLKLPQKVKLALEGTKTERMILMRDPNKLVVKSVLESPKITEEEVIIFLNIKSIDKGIVEQIARSKDWTKKYTVVLGLVNNPKTPVRDAMTLVKKLHHRDLRMLSINRNANPVIRKFALNIQKQRDRVK